MDWFNIFPLWRQDYGTVLGAVPSLASVFLSYWGQLTTMILILFSSILCCYRWRQPFLHLIPPISYYSLSHIFLFYLFIWPLGEVSDWMYDKEFRWASIEVLFLDSVIGLLMGIWLMIGMIKFWIVIERKIFDMFLFAMTLVFFLPLLIRLVNWKVDFFLYQRGLLVEYEVLKFAN